MYYYRSKVSSVAPAIFICDDEAAVIPISEYTMNEAKFDPTTPPATAGEASQRLRKSLMTLSCATASSQLGSRRWNVCPLPGACQISASPGHPLAVSRS